MSDEETAEKKLNRITGVEDLSAAIKKLESEKELMENDFKNQVHYLFQNLNPINVLDHTLQNMRGSSSSKYSLFKEAVAFGAGYLSKRKLFHQLKESLVNAFSKPENTTVQNMVAAMDDKEEEEKETFIETEKNSKIMNLQNEKVKAKPEVLPEPTYWPFFLALGLVFLGWGLLTTWLISLAGFIIFVIALTGWINILRHE